MKIIKQSIGIDCSKDTLDAAISFLDEDFQEIVHATEVFANNPSGFRKFLKWIPKHSIQTLPFMVVVEATGVYHESLACTLVENGIELAIVLPNKIRNYCRSTDIRTVTDNISAKQIAGFGLVKKLDKWVKPDAVFTHLRGLSRERNQLLDEKTVVKNQKHAWKHAEFKAPETGQRLTRRIKLLNDQIDQIECEIEAVINDQPWLKEKFRKICTIKGVGLITAVTIVAETNGFNLIRNSRQLVCLAGYDVVQKQSGTSVKAKTRISHKGNKNIRRALHFPAITAVKYNQPMKKLYSRLFERQKIKMKGLVAVQRKLLVLIYILWKNDTEFDQDYQQPHIKCLEQPIRTALSELDQVRS